MREKLKEDLKVAMKAGEREKFFVEHIEDCRRMGVEVLPPNVNEGEAAFKVACEGKIHFGLAAIKGVGLKAIDAIVAARAKGGAFSGLDDLFERFGPELALESGAPIELLRLQHALPSYYVHYYYQHDAEVAIQSVPGHRSRAEVVADLKGWLDGFVG